MKVFGGNRFLTKVYLDESVLDETVFRRKCTWMTVFLDENLLDESVPDEGRGTPPHADADEPELIAMPPPPASAPPMSNLERCISLRLENGAGPR